MYYLLILLFLIVLYWVFVKILGSLLKGCFTLLGIVILVVIVLIFLKSIKKPVTIFDRYVINNFKITKVKK